MLTTMNINQISEMSKNTILEHLGIQITKLDINLVEGEMPVDHRTHQVFGILHGGASVVLAETLGSIGAMLNAVPGTQCVGLEINANHIRAVKSGKVLGRAIPIHIGKSTQVWEIKIINEDQMLVCQSRITIAVISEKF